MQLIERPLLINNGTNDTPSQGPWFSLILWSIVFFQIADDKIKSYLQLVSTLCASTKHGIWVKETDILALKGQSHENTYIFQFRLGGGDTRSSRSLT